MEQETQQSQGVSVDPQRVIVHLAAQVQEMAVEIAKRNVRIEDLEKEIGELRQTLDAMALQEATDGRQEEAGDSNGNQKRKAAATG